MMIVRGIKIQFIFFPDQESFFCLSHNLKGGVVRVFIKKVLLLFQVIPVDILYFRGIFGTCLLNKKNKIPINYPDFVDRGIPVKNIFLLLGFEIIFYEPVEIRVPSCVLMAYLLALDPYSYQRCAHVYCISLCYGCLQS